MTLTLTSGQLAALQRDLAREGIVLFTPSPARRNRAGVGQVGSVSPSAGPGFLKKGEASEEADTADRAVATTGRAERERLEGQPDDAPGKLVGQKLKVAEDAKARASTVAPGRGSVLSAGSGGSLSRQAPRRFVIEFISPSAAAASELMEFKGVQRRR